MRPLRFVLHKPNRTMGTIDPEQLLFYFLLASGVFLLLMLLRCLYRSPLNAQEEKNAKPRKHASQAS